MTIEKLLGVMTENGIPLNAHIMSDSGWGCDATEMDGIWYNRKANTMIFTQDGSESDYRYSENSDWICIYGKAQGMRGVDPKPKERPTLTVCDACEMRKTCASALLLVSSAGPDRLGYYHLIPKPGVRCHLGKF